MVERQAGSCCQFGNGQIARAQRAVHFTKKALAEIRHRPLIESLVPGSERGRMRRLVPGEKARFDRSENRWEKVRPCRHAVVI
jgi:hypothetical protein